MTADLIRRLEEATEGSRELDALIWRALEPEQVDSLCGFRGMIYAGARFDKAGKAAYVRQMAAIRAPNLTTSLDAALSLAERVLPGWSHMVGFGGGFRSTCMSIGPVTAVGQDEYGEPVPVQDVESGESSTPALAMCIAILKAPTPDAGPQAEEGDRHEQG